MNDIVSPEPQGNGAVARFAALPASVRAASWMVLGAAGFAGMIGVIRHVSQSGGIHPFEIAFFRNVFGLAFMLPWLARSGLGGLRTRRLDLYALRGVLGLVAMLAWFWSITVMPLSEAVALSFTAPLFATMLAALMLGEIVRVRRWTATLIGFAGAMIILRPGFAEIGLPSLMVLLSSLAMGSSVICIKALSRSEPASAIVTYMVLFLTPLSLIPALFVWKTPEPAVWLWLILLGGLATAAHSCFTRAFYHADASAVVPFDFVRLPFAALIGYLAFGQSVDVWTFLGAGVIFGSSVYITRREARLARAVRPASEASKHTAAA